MGSPGTGKSTQLYYIAKWVHEELGKVTRVLDLEDKFEPLLLSELGEVPKYIDLYVATKWQEITEAVDAILGKVKPGDWIGVDRVDLSWPSVQRHYTQIKYEMSLASKMMESAKALKKRAMFIPRFDQGDWQPVNEAYDGDFMHRLLFESRCNLVMTSGIAGVDENSPRDMFGNLGVKPRGQKELGHQTNGVFLLYQKREKSTDPPYKYEDSWYITTAKDLKGREKFDEEMLFDFTWQYLAQYYHK